MHTTVFSLSEEVKQNSEHKQFAVLLQHFTCNGASIISLYKSSMKACCRCMTITVIRACHENNM